MIIIYIFAALVALFLILSLIAPKSYHLYRSVEVNRPLPEVFQFIKYVKNQDYWSPWDKKDPDVKKTHTGTDGEIGFIAGWKGNKEIGEGEQEITHIVENEKMESKLRFFKPWKSESDAYIKVEKIDENNTRVTWGFSGVNKPPSNIFMMFFNMDKTVGKDFEEGLASLKVHLEKENL
jgi:hypothetical protein